MKTRWKMLIIAVTFVGLSLSVSLLSMRVGSENELAAYKKALLDQGVKLQISEVLPPPVAADQNGADLVEAALKLLPAGYIESSNNPPLMQMVAPGKAMVGWRQPQIISFGKYGFTNSWDNVGRVMEMARPAVELLQQTAHFPELDFHLEYEKGSRTPLPDLGPLLICINYLSAMADCELHENDPDAATVNLCTILSLVRGLRDERTVYSQTMRAHMAAMAFTASWELLQMTNLPDTDLSKLQTAWEQVEFIDALEGTLLMDEAMVDEELINMGKTPGTYWGYVPTFRSSTGDLWEDAKRDVYNFIEVGRQTCGQILWENSMRDSMELRFLHDSQDILKTVHAMHTNQLFQPAYSNLVSRIKLADKASGFDFFADKLLGTEWAWGPFNLSMPRINALKKGITTEISRRLTITAIALKRFQLRHGKFPETLAEVTPEFLSVVPLDAMNGQLMHYYRNADGTYVLYSVGENGIDDGGNPTASTTSRNIPDYWFQIDARDWVWPQPATAAEIRKYYADEAVKNK